MKKIKEKWKKERYNRKDRFNRRRKMNERQDKEKKDTRTEGVREQSNQETKPTKNIQSNT